ncbi:hypothetical protein ACQBAU_04445 [Propionibacteriaceae bacterium Y2011]|uniref:hypothetical protein n=1 Tax=Microlunatus sp. Y2014 TaxID=3418488 RepID=UPI003B482F34
MTDHDDQARDHTASRSPRVLVSTTDLAPGPGDRGAVWRLAEPVRDLDSNVINLPASESIDRHPGADVDVLVHVLAGAGTVTTATGDVPVAPGDVVWLPRLSERGFVAGPDGLRYLTVHQKRHPTLTVQSGRPR